MAKPDITVTISPSGEVQLSVSGVKGASCLKATAELESKLGIATNKFTTREFYEHATTNTKNQQ